MVAALAILVVAVVVRHGQSVRAAFIGAAVRIVAVGGIALLSGVLILVGAVAMTKFQRVYEAAILRTLGAGTRLLTMTLALEYCALGLLAGVIGAAGMSDVERLESGHDSVPAVVRLDVGARSPA